jgi:hypothetical protein
MENAHSKKKKEITVAMITAPCVMHTCDEGGSGMKGHDKTTLRTDKCKLKNKNQDPAAYLLWRWISHDIVVQTTHLSGNKQQIETSFKNFPLFTKTAVKQHK